MLYLQGKLASSSATSVGRKNKYCYLCKQKAILEVQIGRSNLNHPVIQVLLKNIIELHQKFTFKFLFKPHNSLPKRFTGPPDNGNTPYYD